MPLGLAQCEDRGEYISFGFSLSLLAPATFCQLAFLLFPSLWHIQFLCVAAPSSRYLCCYYSLYTYIDILHTHLFYLCVEMYRKICLWPTSFFCLPLFIFFSFWPFCTTCAYNATANGEPQTIFKAQFIRISIATSLRLCQTHFLRRQSAIF